MHILITSGGTKVPIDPVRHIGNKSRGRFGKKLAIEALKASLQVTYLASCDAESPFSFCCDFSKKTPNEVNLEKFNESLDFANTYRNNFSEIRYQNYDEYSRILQEIVQTQKPDIVMLAAAVSDYLVANYSQHKIRSSEQLSIELTPAKKLIRQIKQWAPDTFLVGFKLLVHVSDAEMIKVAREMVSLYGIDLVIANDLASIERGAHEVIIVAPNGNYIKHSSDVAKNVMNTVLKGHIS